MTGLPLGKNERVAGARSFVCCNVRVDPLPLTRAVEAVVELGERRSGAVHLCTANNLALASRDHAYADVLNRGALNLPDGASLVLLTRRVAGSRLRQAERPRGADVLTVTIDRGRERRLRHFLYGGDSRTLASLRTRLERAYPGAEIVGWEAPPFRPLTPDEEVTALERIAATQPHIVWVALGTPRQDYVVDAFRERIDATFVAVGAAFDFVAGSKRAAPRWVQRSGLEWLFRLVTEPRRLWKRYLVGNVLFLRCASQGVAAVPEKSP